MELLTNVDVTSNNIDIVSTRISLAKYTEVRKDRLTIKHTNISFEEENRLICLEINLIKKGFLDSQTTKLPNLKIVTNAIKTDGFIYDIYDIIVTVVFTWD